MSPKQRCPCRTLGGTKCMNKSKTHMNMCWVHYKKSYTEYAKSIQHAWNSYRCRKVSHVFRRLPTDLQTKIVWYIQEPFLIQKHHHETIVKIIRTRMESSIICKYIIPQYPDWNDNINDITKLCNLCKKYISIIPTDVHLDFENKIYKFMYNIRPIVYTHESEYVRYISDMMYDLNEFFDRNMC